MKKKFAIKKTDLRLESINVSSSALVERLINQSIRQLKMYITLMIIIGGEGHNTHHLIDLHNWKNLIFIDRKKFSYENDNNVNT